MQCKNTDNYSIKLSQEQASIVADWMSCKDVQKIFKLHSISTKKFESKFTNKIFDYYISVIENRNDINNCPFIHFYLEFLSKKGVTPDELFIICINFRKSIIKTIYKINITSLEIIDEVSNVSDYSIKTLLKHFYEIYKEDEELILKKKRSLLEAQKISKVGHWELDLRSENLYWSDEAYQLFEVDSHDFELTYESVLECIHPDDVDIVKSSYRDSIQHKTACHIVYRIITLNNEIKYVEERCSHHFDDEGNVFRSIGTYHDITDKMNDQKELRLTSKLFEHSNDAVIISDVDNKIVMANKAFTNLTGYTLDEIKGKNPKYISSGWGDESFYKDMWENIINNNIWQGEVVDQTKSGEIYTAKLTILCIRDSEENITNFIGITNDISEQKEQKEEIMRLSYYDALTKLPNRVLFQERVKEFIKSNKSDKTKFAILFFDLDNFKWLNDSMGHKVGNKALIEVTDRINTLISEETFFCRMGGDEFAILYPYKNITDVINIADKIMQTTAKPINLESRDISIGISIGISFFPNNGMSYGALLQAADTAMYQAKANGRNNYVFFNQTMNDSSVKRLDIDTQLRQAIEKNHFSMVYQPKVSLSTNEMYGAEALIRWNDPLLGFVPPDIFIPIAEESKLIEDIGYWVIEQSLKDFSEMFYSTNQELVISINVSAKQFKDKQFVKKISKLINASNVSSKNIEFEITETAIMDNIDEISKTLNEISALGINISIDDFGTGHSSMAYLKKLPIHTIKIDRAFVKDIHIDANDKAIVKAIVTMSKQLGIMTIAEGIETQEHETILFGMGVDSGQGYLYSKPLTHRDFSELL